MLLSRFIAGTRKEDSHCGWSILIRSSIDAHGHSGVVKLQSWEVEVPELAWPEMAPIDSEGKVHVNPLYVLWQDRGTWA